MYRHTMSAALWACTVGLAAVVAPAAAWAMDLSGATGEAMAPPRAAVSGAPDATPDAAGSSVGACCFEPNVAAAEGPLEAQGPELSCLAMDEDDCDDIGGIWLGGGTTCSPNPCANTGACCLGIFSLVETGIICFEATESACNAIFGEYQGDGTRCREHTCLDIGACCVLGHCVPLPEFICHFIGDYQGDDTTCETHPCNGQVLGACCFQDGSCQVASQGDCEKNLGGEYQGDGTTCEPNPCPQVGACCINIESTNACNVVTADLCAKAGGLYQGDGTTCPEACQGACCLPDGLCENETFDINCVSSGGTFQGFGSNCKDGPCPQPIQGACCFGAGACTVNTQDYCEKELQGEYQGDGTTCEPDPCIPGACCVSGVNPTGNGVGCIEVSEAECLSLKGVFQGILTSCKYGECAEDCNHNGVPDDQETAPECDPLASMPADECEYAECVCTDIFYNGNTFAATHDTNLFCGLIYGGLYDVWYSYRPATDGTAVVKVCNYNFDFIANGNPYGPQQYGFGLTGTQEVPPVASTGSGTACVTLNTATNELSWNVSYQGLTGPVMAAHFHGPAPAGVNAGVQLNITPVVIDDGTGTGTAVGSAILTPAQVTQVQAELWYLNFHTAMFPGGEIRGQVRHGPCTSGNLPVIAVFEACPDTDDVVEPLACNFASAVGTNCGVIFEAQGGETYYIRIAGEGNTRGWFELEVKGPPCLLNPDDINNNGIPDECECLGDVDDDGDVDGDDVNQVINALGTMCPWGCPEDINADGIVDNNDLEHVVAMLGPCPEFENNDKD